MTASPAPRLRPGAVALKALLLFTLLNLAFGAFQPMPFLGRLSIYNHLVPGRDRLPYGDDPTQAYNLSLFQLDAMFASHTLAAGPKPEGEFRVILVGDSSVWGFLLPPDQTLANALNRAGYRLPDGRRLRAYNLGYPVMSVTKDLLLLERALAYEPDLIVWPVTLESLPSDKQLFPPLLQHNGPEVRRLIQEYDLNLDPDDPNLVQPGFWESTLIGRRRDLADWLRLQLYGVLWAATGIDQVLPDEYTPRQEDLTADPAFHEFQPPHLPAEALAFDLLAVGQDMAGSTPVLFVNEPMFISQGANSDIRYNFYYPRWAYDDYRSGLRTACQSNGWRCLDLWDAISPDEFTNTAVHLSPEGQAEMAGLIGSAILEMVR